MIACRCRFHLGCTVHDDAGKRWDAYTIDDVARIDGVTFEQSQEEWSCYCGRHEATDNEMPVGTACIWRKTSYEYDEWECECAESYRDTWLSHQSVDWSALGRADDRRYRRTKWLRRLRAAFADLIPRARIRLYRGD